MKSKLAGFTDSMFLRLLIFALFFMWATFYTNAVNAALAAFSAAVSVSGLLAKRASRTDCRSEFEETVLLQLSIMPRDKGVDLVYGAVTTRRSAVKTESGVKTGKTFLCPLFSAEPPGADSVAAALCAADGDRVVLLTVNGISASAEKLLGRMEKRVFVKSGREVFTMLKATGVFPEITVRKPPLKKRGLAAFGAAFSRDKTRKYLFASAVLFLGAYMLPYAVYYLIAACACLTAAVISLTGAVRLIGGKKRK